MDFEKLVPFIKKALENNNVTPTEVAAVLQDQHSGTDQDQNNETVDSGVVDNTNPQQEEVKNEEGKLLESTFKELEIEDAIDQAKERKSYDDPSSTGDGNLTNKIANAWQLLVYQYGKSHGR